MRDQGQYRSRVGVEGDHRPALLAQGGGGRPLQVVAEGELHLVGAQVPAEQGEQGGGQRAVVAGAQVGGVGGLDPGVAEVAAGVADGVAVEVALGVGAHQGAVGPLFRLGHDDPVGGEDGTALPGGPVQEGAGVAHVLAVAGAGDRLMEGEAAGQQHQARQAGGGEAAQGGVHEPSSWEIRASRAISTRLASSDDPP